LKVIFFVLGKSTIVRDKMITKNRGRHFSGTAFGWLGFCTSWAVDKRGHGPEWIEVVEVDLNLPSLSEQFHGKTIVHVSDLHCSRTVSSKYLRRCVDRINLLDADIVVLTGDYITHDMHGRFREKVVDVIGGIRSRLGVYACLGNHDYGMGGLRMSRRDDGLMDLIEGMETGGVNVMRNSSSMVEVDGKGLWLVGLGDKWARDFEPEKAFADVPDDEVVVTLIHNPATVRHLEDFAFDAVMCGHTHGNPLALTAFPQERVMNRRSYYSGMYEIGPKKLYVNRGLGRLGRAFFNTRPEITVYNLC